MSRCCYFRSLTFSSDPFLSQAANRFSVKLSPLHAICRLCTALFLAFHFIHSPYLNATDRNANLKLITRHWRYRCRCSSIQETLLLPPLSLYLRPFMYYVSLPSMSNLLCFSHVCWSCAREAWDYYDWRQHTDTQKYTALVYTFRFLPFNNWVTTEMCQGTFMFTVNGVCGLRGTSQCGSRSGKPSLLLLQCCIRGRWFSADSCLLGHFLTLMFQSGRVKVAGK